MRVKTACVAVVTAFSIVGCNGVGKGSKPEKLDIGQFQNGSLNTDMTETDTYTCLTAQLSAYVTFTDNDDIGDFRQRARWSSSDESVVVVSNYNQPVSEKLNAADGSVYTDGGTLYPTANLSGDETATAQVTVEYLGMTDTIDVVVNAVTGLRILPKNVKVVPKSNTVYTVRAKLAGVETDVTNLATLKLVKSNSNKVPSEDIAVFSTSSGSNVVSAVGAQPEGEFLRVKATFEAPCAAAPVTRVRVENMKADGLKLGYETGYESGKLAEGTTEFLTLKATFEDGTTQDLSSQVRTRFDYDRDGDGLCEIADEAVGTNGTTVAASCNDGEDNDGDGKTDFPTDPGCESVTDDDEIDPAPIAFSGLLTGLNLAFANIDDDDDSISTKICAVFGADAVADSDNPDLAACEDGVDNDDDGKIDFAGGDPECASADDNNEGDEGIKSDTIDLQVVDQPLASFAVTATDPCKPEETGCTPLDPIDQNNLTIKAGQIIRFLASGSFAPPAPAYVQDITKDVVWTLSVEDEDADFAPAVIVSGRSSVAGTMSTLMRFTGVDGCEDMPTCRIHVKAVYTRGDSDEENDVTVEKVLTVTDPLPDDEETTK